MVTAAGMCSISHINGIPLQQCHHVASTGVLLLTESKPCKTSDNVVLFRLLNRCCSVSALMVCWGWCRQDLQMRLLSVFVDFALNPLEGKQVWDLGALLPAIAALSQDLPAHHAVSKNKAHSNSFDILQVLQEDDANKIKVACITHDFDMGGRPHVFGCCRVLFFMTDSMMLCIACRICQACGRLHLVLPKADSIFIADVPAALALLSPL